MTPEDIVINLDDIAEKVAASLREKISIDKCIENLKRHLGEQLVTYVIQKGFNSMFQTRALNFGC